jgi:hypothetical protein
MVEGRKGRRKELHMVRSCTEVNDGRKLIDSSEIDRGWEYEHECGAREPHELQTGMGSGDISANEPNQDNYSNHCLQAVAVTVVMILKSQYFRVTEVHSILR